MRDADYMRLFCFLQQGDTVGSAALPGVKHRDESERTQK
jgi:hypothetical protein